MAKEDRDNRLDQIKEGAGLEDSRINQEFVDFLRKWSTPVLLILALLALGYFLNNKRKEARAAFVDEAFQQLNLTTATGSPSPDALKQIAEDYSSVEGVRVLALTAAADEYLRAVQRGVIPGAAMDPSTGDPESEADYLSEEDEARFLSEAEQLYKQVYNITEKQPTMALHTLTALYGLAAVSESRADSEAAKNMLNQANALAQKHGYLEQSSITNMRLTGLPEVMSETIDLPSKADLPEIPALQAPPPTISEEPGPGEGDTGEVGPQLPEQAPPVEEGDPAEQGGVDGAGEGVGDGAGSTESDAGDDDGR